MTVQPSPFAGTAAYYAQYRPPYPDALLAELRSRVKTTGSGALLDLACGPGRVAIPLAQHFNTVLAVDAEAEMIAVGKQQAAARGVTNIDWRVARAEDLQLPDHSLELITIGEAFHRLDPDIVVEHALQWLRPRGALATLGGEPVWRGEAAWQRALVEVVNRWTAGALGDPNERAWGGPNDALRAAGLLVEEGEWAVRQTWTCDSIIGFMFSTSIASRWVLGEGANHFAAELRAALLALAPSGRFDAMQKFSFTLGVSPH